MYAIMLSRGWSGGQAPAFGAKYPYASPINSRECIGYLEGVICRELSRLDSPNLSARGRLSYNGLVNRPLASCQARRGPCSARFHG
jgi:hypothetical protein